MNSDPLRYHVDFQPVAPVAEMKFDPFHFFRKQRVEMQGVSTGVQAGIAPLDDIYASGHGPEMDPFRGRSPLDITDIGLQGLLKKLPGPFSVPSGRHPGMDEGTQGGPVGCPLQIVIDVGRDMFRFETLSQLLEQFHQLF